MHQTYRTATKRSNKNEGITKLLKQRARRRAHGYPEDDEESGRRRRKGGCSLKTMFLSAMIVFMMVFAVIVPLSLLVMLNEDHNALEDFGKHHHFVWKKGGGGVRGMKGILRDFLGGADTARENEDEEEEGMDNGPTIPNRDIDVKEEPLEQNAFGKRYDTLPMSETPALVGAQRGHIECDVDVDDLVYWNDPQGDKDRNFKSPFADKDKVKYLSFEPDSGGWNNIRISMENMFVIAAATGRTLVLPPDLPLYLLKNDKKRKHRGFADFFPLEHPALLEQVPIISMKEFIEREGGTDGRLPVPNENRTRVTNAQSRCENRFKSKSYCGPLWDYMSTVGTIPQLSGKSCLVFDVDSFQGKTLQRQNKEQAKDFCSQRKMVIYDSKLHDPILLHFKTSKRGYRILEHFYAFTLFTDPKIGNHFKRFIRDFLRYKDSIYCAAGKIVHALQQQAKEQGFLVDSEGNGGYSSLHIRRGDFQYKKVKIPAEEWYANTKEIWLPNEILYIATDEKNKTFFDPIAKHHTLKFLSDYWEDVGLADIDPNYMGMIDTIVASRGREFAGTFFSTFTGYINRMRGYHGMSMKSSWYGTLSKKTDMHIWGHFRGAIYAREWPNGWVGINGNEIPSQKSF